MSSSTFTNDTIRDAILKAARRRFQRYGYTKTNLHEIATDVNMSAGNLYRYFKNKRDIALACCVQLINERTQEIRNIIQDPQLTCSDRLRIYALSILSHSKTMAADPAYNNELAELMTTGCPDLIHNKFAQQLSIIGTILSQGNHNGEFQIDNVHDKAKTIHTALLVLEVPGFIPLFSEKAWEARILSLIDSLLTDLS